MILILILCFLAFLTWRIVEIEKRLVNTKVEKVETKEETKEQIEQKNKKEAFERMLNYDIQKAYESKVK